MDSDISRDTPPICFRGIRKQGGVIARISSDVVEIDGWKSYDTQTFKT